MRKEELPELSGFTMVMREKYSLVLSCQIKKLGQPLKDTFNRIQCFPHLSQMSICSTVSHSNLPCKSASHVPEKRTRFLQEGYAERALEQRQETGLAPRDPQLTSRSSCCFGITRGLCCFTQLPALQVSDPCFHPRPPRREHAFLLHIRKALLELYYIPVLSSI